MPDEKEPSADEIDIKLKFRIPSRMPSVYAHHMTCQIGANEVLLSFFEVIPPLIPEITSEDQLKYLQETGIVAECVARITVAKEAFPNFVRAMQQTIEQEVTSERPQDDANSTRDNPES